MISQIFLDDDDLTETVHLGRERQRRAKQCSSLNFFIYKQQLLIWSFWVVAILMAEFRWKLSFQPGLSQPVSPTTANSYRSIIFGLFRHRFAKFIFSVVLGLLLQTTVLMPLLRRWALPRYRSLYCLCTTTKTQKFRYCIWQSICNYQDLSNQI